MSKFYTLTRILRADATYNIVIGQRSNGKTYAVLRYMLDQHVKTGSECAVIRRHREDFQSRRGDNLFSALVSNGEVRKITKGEWNTVVYRRRAWFLAKDTEDGLQIAQFPFCYSFALTEMESDKGNSYPKIDNVLFDEFLSRRGYLPEEFVLFMNTVSTITRRRKGVRFFLLGNTVNKYCPYFKEMGLTRVPSMQPGDMAVYRFGESDLKVAVEMADKVTTKESDYYFAFDNPRLKMITGGSWEVDVYPHLPYRYRPADVVYQFFVLWEDSILHCELITGPEGLFIFVHPKTTPIKDESEDLVYSPEPSHRFNRLESIYKPTNRLTQEIARLFKLGKVFYSDNETGEVMRNYLMWCRKA